VSEATVRPLTVLFVMETPEYLRFFDSVLALLLERGHRVILAVNEDKQKKPVRLERFGDGHASLTLAGVAPVPHGMWAEIGKGLRGTMDFVRFLHPDYRSAPALRARMYRKVLPVAFRPLNWIPTMPTRMNRAVLSFLEQCELAIPPSAAVVDFVKRANPDALLVSPLIDAASVQVEFIKAAQSLGIPTGACIASWDNLTNKGLLRIKPDVVTVWNEAQRGEAERYHGIARAKVTATGAQLFDRWFERRPSTTRTEFCAKVGLPDDRPFVIFTGSSGFISETSAEVAFVRRWIEELRLSDDPAIKEIGVVVRPHPYNYRGWIDADLGAMSPATVWPRGPYNPVAEDSRAAYYDSLYHAAAVVGINTSAMIEAAILERPVFSILTPEFQHTQEGTLHFRHLLVESGGPVSVASSLREHVDQLSRVMREPTAYAARTRAFVGKFLRPHGADRPATPILADAIEQLAASGRRSPRTASGWHGLLRLMVLAGALPAGSVGRLSDARWRGRMRKEASKMAARFKKQMRRGTRRNVARAVRAGE
jgi:hypothetical protein